MLYKIFLKIYSPNIISKTNAISMQNTIHNKTEKKSMQSERKKKGKDR